MNTPTTKEQFSRDFSKKTLKQLEAKGIKITGTQSIPGFDGDKYYTGVAYQLFHELAGGFVRTHSQVIVLANSSWQPTEPPKIHTLQDRISAIQYTIDVSHECMASLLAANGVVCREQLKDEESARQWDIEFSSVRTLQGYLSRIASILDSAEKFALANCG